MPQTTYNLNMDAAIAGMKADSRFDTVESFKAFSDINFGRGLIKGAADNSQARLPQLNNVVITDDAGTFTAGDVVVNVNSTDVTETFDTDKDTTMAALAASIQALATVATAVYTSGTHIITIVAANDVALVVTVDVSGITGNMTISSIVATTNDSVVRGIALHTQMANRTLPVMGAQTYEAAGYKTGDTISVLRQGKVWVDTSDAVVLDAAVYLDTSSGKEGQFTDASSGNIAVPTGKFRSATSGAGLAKVEINMP